MLTSTDKSITTTVTVWQYEPETASSLESDSSAPERNPFSKEDLYIPAIETIFTANDQFQMQIKIDKVPRKTGYELRPNKENANPSSLNDFTVTERDVNKLKSIDLKVAARILLSQETQSEIYKRDLWLKDYVSKSKLTLRGKEYSLNNAIHLKDSTGLCQLYIPKLKVLIDKNGKITFAEKVPENLTSLQQVPGCVDENDLEKIITLIQLRQEYEKETTELMEILRKVRLSDKIQS